MLSPAALHRIGVEPALRAHLVWIEQVFRPAPQRALDPFADGHSEPGLGPVDELGRDEAVEQLADDVLSAALLDLKIERDARGEFSDAMVEERDAGFERDRHRRAVDFGQDVVGQVADRVAIHHADSLRGVDAEVEIEAEVGIFAAKDRRALVAPFVEEAQINIVEAAGGSGDAQPFLDFSAEVRLVPRCAATRLASSASLKPASSKPIEKVRTGTPEYFW